MNRTAHLLLMGSVASVLISQPIKAGAVCGNGLVESSEVCDDGNILSGDGCSFGCLNENAGVLSTSPLGTNLTFLTDYSTEYPFVDAFRTSRVWISGDANNWSVPGATVDTDADGWVRSVAPGQIVRTLLYWGDLRPMPYPAGQYIVLYEGEGTVEYRMASSPASIKNTGASSPGRDVIDVDPALGGILINITAVNPANYLRNIRVIVPGGACSNDSFKGCTTSAECGGAPCTSFEQNYAAQIFHPNFLERIRNYRTLRFMDWMDTNGSLQQDWANRPKVADARWSDKGAPVETMVELANRLHANAWFSMPHMATNDYIQQFAIVVRDALHPSLKTHIEYSNEVWNGLFDQADYAQTQGLALGLSANPFQAQLFFQSQRSVQIFNIWESVFGGLGRLVRVLAAQAGNPWTGIQVMDFQNAYLHADAFAIAPYLGGTLGRPSDAPSTVQMTVAEILNHLQFTMLPELVTQNLQTNFANANQRNLPLIAYEGGQHLVGVGGEENNAALNALFDAVNRAPGIKAVYTAYLDAWKSSGGQDFNHFIHVTNYTKWGRFGSLESRDQPMAEAPKYQALQEFIANNPKWWTDSNSGPDTISPTVTLTTPGNGAAVSGTVSVAAAASDNVGVMGVQFKLNGNNLFSEDIGYPYTISWDTNQTSNDNHILTAVARDAAGNTATSAPISITVNNSSTQSSNFRLSDVRITPMPFKPNGPVSHIFFEHMPVGAEIKIYDRKGRRLADLQNPDSAGTLGWNATNTEGRPVPSGTYFAYISSSEGKITKTIVIIR